MDVGEAVDLFDEPGVVHVLPEVLPQYDLPMVTAPPLKLSLALHDREPSVKGAKVLVLGSPTKPGAEPAHAERLEHELRERSGEIELLERNRAARATRRAPRRRALGSPR